MRISQYFLGGECGLRDKFSCPNGLSKAYGTTGRRVGYAAGPLPLIKAMNMVAAQRFRVSYATGTDVLEEACSRIQRACAALS